MLLECLVVQGDLPPDHLVGLGWPDEEDLALSAYPPHGGSLIPASQIGG